MNIIKDTLKEFDEILEQYKVHHKDLGCCINDHMAKYVLQDFLKSSLTQIREIASDKAYNKSCNGVSQWMNFGEEKGYAKFWKKKVQEEVKREIPMGASNWLRHGKKYGYWNHFKNNA